MRTLFGSLALATAFIFAIGCSSSSTTGGTGSQSPGTSQAQSPKAKKKPRHDPGPHKGLVFDWGNWHLEFCVDHAKEEVRIYVYGSDEETPAPIKTDKLLVSFKDPVFQMELKPEKQPNDPEGAYSCFVGKAKQIGRKQDFAGTVTGTVEGKQYNEDFSEEEGHDHDHSHKK